MGLLNIGCALCNLLIAPLVGEKRKTQYCMKGVLADEARVAYAF